MISISVLCIIHLRIQLFKKQINSLSTFDKSEEDITKYSSMGNIVLWGDFYTRINVSDIGFVLDNYEIKLEDLHPTLYITDSVFSNRKSLEGNVKTFEYGRMLLDLCILCQCQILNDRTVGDTIGNIT